MKTSKVFSSSLLTAAFFLTLPASGFAQFDTDPRKESTESGGNAVNPGSEPSSQRGGSSLETPSRNRKQSSVQKSTPHRDASPFFPDWGAPSMSLFLAPILGFAWEEKVFTITRPDGQTETVEAGILTAEGGLRVGLNGIPLAPGNPGVSLSPYVGYAYGKNFSLDDTEGVRDSTYHRFLLGETTSLRIKMFKYDLGVHFGRIFGDPEDVTAVSQLDVVQDFGLKTTERTSLHTTVTVGRLFADTYGAYSTQYTDVWLHFRMNPFLSAVFDIGPGQDFQWFPQSEVAYSNIYFKALFDWALFGPLGIAGRLRYEISQEEGGARGGVAVSTREPSQDLGTPSQRGFRPEDATSFLFFAGLRDVFLGWSIGYVSLYDVTNTFERNGKRSSEHVQGLGVYSSLTF